MTSPLVTGATDVSIYAPTVGAYQLVRQDLWQRFVECGAEPRVARMRIPSFAMTCRLRDEGSPGSIVWVS